MDQTQWRELQRVTDSLRAEGETVFVAVIQRVGSLTGKEVGARGLGTVLVHGDLAYPGDAVPILEHLTYLLADSIRSRQTSEFAAQQAKLGTPIDRAFDCLVEDTRTQLLRRTR